MLKFEYTVIFSNERAEKDFFKTLSQASKNEQERILEWFDELAVHPRPAGKSFKYLKGDIPIFKYAARYRIREGDWRILYDIDDASRKVILLALRRRGPDTY